MIFNAENQELRAHVARAVERLMAFRNSDGGRMMIDVPVTYPSGASVVIEVEQNSDRIWVSDMGKGLVEAEMMAAEESYRRLARAKADEFGVGYDNSAMFVLWAPVDKLESAIVCVANASAQASADAVRHAVEARSRNQSDTVYERIVDVFGKRLVSRSTKINGRRFSWSANNVVFLHDAHQAVFEPMTKSANSISSKYLMFSDLRNSEASIYSLNAVVENKRDLGGKAQMVGDLANIIDLNSSDEAFKRYAVAA